MRIIDFTPPMSGIEGEFNTFRLGRGWVKRIAPRDTVLLMDGKQMEVIGEAVVTAIHTGSLEQMSALHASRNHNQKMTLPDHAATALQTAMIKRYGPQRCGLNSVVTVICLRRLK